MLGGTTRDNEIRRPEMNLNLIKSEYRDEMIAVFGRLAELVRSEFLSPDEFLAAQARVFESYRMASE
jgi:hypothetical protein